MKVKVVAAVGRNGSGKDALIDYLHERCGLEVFVVGDLVREQARREGLRPTRENLHAVSGREMEKHGEGCFTRRLAERLKSADRPAGVSGLRTPADVEVLREEFGAELLVVHVEVSDPALRFERLRRRNEPRDPDTYEEFWEQERSEEEMFQVSETLRKADETVRNDGSLEDFHRNIEEALRPCSFHRVPVRGRISERAQSAAAAAAAARKNPRRCSR